MAEQIGPYRIGTVIGESAMGTVYRGFDRERERLVLIVVAHNPDTDVGHTRRMRREAVSLFELTHPNLVTVIDVGALAGYLYVIVEHVDGPPIDRYALERGLSWPRVLELFAGAGRGLAAAHGRAIVHGALSPACIKVDERERVRVTEFAIARPDRAGIGVPSRAPPTIYSDQRAFAAMLERSLERAGRSYFRGVPRTVRRALARAMAPEARERYASMYELLHALGV